MTKQLHDSSLNGTESEETPFTSGGPSLASRTAVEGGRGLHVVGRFGLLILMVLVGVVFSVWKPSSFFVWQNFNAIFAQQAIIAMVAFGVIVPLIVGEFDLSVGANAGLASVFTVGLCDNQHVTPWLAIVFAIAISTAIGVVNGLIITKLKVNSFVATLGTATAIGGFGELYTHELDLQTAPAGLTDIGRASVGSLQLTVIIAIVAGFVLLIMLQYLPVGRQLFAVGANRRAAELTGIRSDVRVLFAFAIAGLIVGVGGALYGANLGGASNSTGSTLLLPAFAGAFLGSTAIFPGRFNVLGTVIAILLLAFTVAGLEQVGVQPWVQDVVQGVALVAAVAVSSWSIRTRSARLRDIQLRLLSQEKDDSGGPTSRAE